ncbi:MAG: ADP-forming succinate--CoA ligase subunit beta [Verrucomicrobiales bacterium]|nr:ADP-forming succinate--CoA ligase subunit beta [Verrucomicrobiales bacterium]
MNIHEYQAKELFDKYGVATPAGRVANSVEQVVEIAKELGTDTVVVKAQIHAGGRGKGTFKSGFQGGVHLCDSPEKAGEIAGKMLGEVLVTHQSGEEGKQVNKVLVAASVDIDKEFYFAILMDRETERAVIVASSEGGVDIEDVAENTPEKLIRVPIHPTLGLQDYQARTIAKQIGFTSKQMRPAAKLFAAAYELFMATDCSMVEINPLVLTTDGEVIALDAKFGFDDNALFRHPEIAALRDTDEEDPREVAASKFDLNYIGLDGNIACMVNGAGLAMATMDIIKHFGGDPANFLDVGGGATEEQVREAFRILAGDPKVDAILVNIFGGIMQCDVIAQGIINAANEIEMNLPLIVRLEGTNVKEGRQLLEESGINLITASDLGDAAKKAVESVA